MLSIPLYTVPILEGKLNIIWMEHKRTLIDIQMWNEMIELQIFLIKKEKEKCIKEIIKTFTNNVAQDLSNWLETYSFKQHIPNCFLKDYL